MTFAPVGWVPHLPQQSVALGPLGTRSHGNVALDVVLKPSSAAGLRAFATAVSTPGSPSFRRFLSPAEFAARFGASSKTIAAVERSLRERGLRVTGVTLNRLIVHVTGPTATVEHALGVSLVDYRLPGGSIVYANTSTPVLPRAVAAHIASIVGLDSLAAPARAGLVRARRVAPHAVRAPATGTAGPQLDATCAQQVASAAQNYSALVTSTDLANAYGVTDLYNAGNTGAGSVVAVIEFSSFITGDIGTFASCYGITPHVSEVPVDGGPGPAVSFGPGTGDQVEAELDIEAILGLAPNTTIDVYEAPQDSPGTSALDVFTEAIDNPDVQVISTSWGRCEPAADQSLITAETTLFQQSAAEGKTIVAAAGDNGSEDCYGQTFGFQKTDLAVDDPASQPFVTGAGGTTFTTLGPPAAATVWNTPTGAGGGGISSMQPMPSYQSAAAASLGGAQSCNGSCREVPDVAADAGTPFATYCTESGRDGCDANGWTGFGGTSLASPIWAAIFALANSSPACASKRIGFANPALYAIAGGAGYASAFGDVTTGNNDLGFQGGIYAARAGYDLATGLGTPIAGAGTGGGGGLVDQLCSGAGPVPATAITRISPAAGPARGATRVTIHGSGLASATAVHFGTKAAKSFGVASAGTIVAVAPGGTGTIAITVTSGLGTSPPVAAARFTYLALPAVRRLSPASGSRGTKVTVTGTGFVAVSGVRFGAKKAASLTLVSPTRLRAVAPAGTGIAAVTVTTAGGTSAKTQAGQFHYR
ncbi:MAG TPA: protease pro-enzyme activation domain-containing protein [Gaiellaceae bacterium]